MPKEVAACGRDPKYLANLEAPFPRITYDEAIEIVKEYGSEDSYRFVNGVLDGIWKSIQKEA